MKIFKRIPVVAGLVLCLGTTAMGGNKVVVNVDLPECPYYDSRLDVKLHNYLALIDRAEVTYPDSAQRARLAGDRSLFFDDILKIGEECDGRFLIKIDIDRIDIERRKVTVIPLVVYRYRVYGVMKGKLNIIDVTRKRVLESRDLDFEVKEADQWQVYDDDPDHPALLLPADRRINLLDRVDDKAAENLFEQIKKMTRGAYNRG